MGRAASSAISKARGQVASMLGASQSEITFMSGGTETINYVLKGCARLGLQRMRDEASSVVVVSAEREDQDRARAALPRVPEIVISAVEHVAVLRACEALEEEGLAKVVVVPVDASGRVAVQAVADAVTDATVLVSIMHANNEVGTLQPIAHIARACRAKNPRVLVHTDASQSVGKVPVSVGDLQVDFLTVAAHKLYAHKGVGALYARSSTPTLPSLLHGASHEHGRRAGTEATLLIVGLGEACALAEREVHAAVRECARLREKLATALRAHCRVPVYEHGPTHAHDRLPNTLSVAFGGNVLAGDVLARLSNDVALSAGAACHSDDAARADEAASTPASTAVDTAPAHGYQISHVLRAMGVPPPLARSTLRLSVGRFSTDKDVEMGALLVAEAVNALAYVGRGA